MVLRKESLFVWLGLAASIAIILISVGERVNVWAAGDEQAATAVSVVPLQLGRESYGLAMVDTKSESIWIYEVNTKGAPHSRLKLMAARSWHYDKMLDEYNSGDPKPQEVKDIIERFLNQKTESREKKIEEPNQKQNAEVRIQKSE